jgi:heme-degrading monooxygenase HmoA
MPRRGINTVLEHALLDVRPGHEQAFEAAFSKAQNIIASAQGYRWHRLERCVERPSRYLLLVQWSSLEAHTEGFRGSPGYLQWKALLHHFYEPFPTVNHFKSVFTMDQTTGDSDLS